MSKKKQQQQKKKMRDFRKKKKATSRREAVREDQEQAEKPLPRGGNRPDFASSKTGTRSVGGGGGSQMHRPQGG